MQQVIESDCKSKYSSKSLGRIRDDTICIHKVRLYVGNLRPCYMVSPNNMVHALIDIILVGLRESLARDEHKSLPQTIIGVGHNI